MPNPIIEQTIGTVTAAETVIDSAIALINGIPAMVNNAVQLALANGATADQLAPFTQLNADLNARKDALAAAVAANTTPAPTPPAS